MPPEVLDLDEKLLNERELRRHLLNLEALGSRLEITLKRSPSAPSESATMEELVLPLVHGDIFGGQIGFHQAGVSWLDTLVSTREGVRLIRLRLSA